MSSMPMKASRSSLTFSISVVVDSSSISIAALPPFDLSLNVSLPLMSDFRDLPLELLAILTISQKRGCVILDLNVPHRILPKPSLMGSKRPSLIELPLVFCLRILATS